MSFDDAVGSQLINNPVKMQTTQMHKDIQSEIVVLENVNSNFAFDSRGLRLHPGGFCPPALPTPKW